MEGGRSGYTSLLKRSSWFCRLLRIMKSPGSSCAAAIVMFDHLTSKVRARIFSFVFPSSSLKAGIKSLPKNCSSGLCYVIFKFFQLGFTNTSQHSSHPGETCAFPIHLVEFVLNLTIFHHKTRRFSGYDFSLGVTLKPSCRHG